MLRIIKTPDRQSDVVVVGVHAARGFTPSHYRQNPESGAASQEDDSAVQRAGLETARSQAERMVAEAEARAATIAREAMARGYTDGRAEGLRAAEEQCAEYLHRLAELARSATIDREAMIRSAQPELAALAVAIAAKLIRRELAADPSLIHSMVESALQKVGSADSVRVLVHPDDAQLLQDKWLEMRGSVAFGRDWEVIGDERMERGGCVIETRGGRVDSRIETQLGEIAEAFEVGR